MTAADILFFGCTLAAAAGIAFYELHRSSSRCSKRLAGLLQNKGEVVEPFWNNITRKIRKNLAKQETLGTVISTVALLALAGILKISLLTAIVLLAVVIPGTWWLIRHLRLRKLRRMFAERFSDAVEHLTRAVQAGVPVEKALATIGETYEGELGRRFSLLVQQLELGISFRDAARNFSGDLNMPDVNFFCAVLALNRESGSRLTPMLISLSRTLRERRAVGRKIKVMTSETRSAAKVLSLLPCLVLAMQFFLNPTHFDFLFYDSTGRFILGCCAGLMVLGITIINRMSRLGGAE